ncbi:hypothetical protein DdX_01323 [Ditylenchus destructor]|uniref:Uncharacterized protein n=2 Tax=Ditylenchus destructor TaxID=166010 RepID=A0AAD4NLD5_9BILA|nr:hypothetical protein DdX_01323 [Ditylenchus destructor]
MPKVYSTITAKFRQWISIVDGENGTKLYSVDAGIIYFQACQKKVESYRISHLKQHHDGSKHVTNAHRFLGNSATRQMFLQPEPSDPFAADLSYALISANIPLYKVNHPDFRGFLEKYSKRNHPVMRCGKKFQYLQTNFGR